METTPRARGSRRFDRNEELRALGIVRVAAAPPVTDAQVITRGLQHSARDILPRL